LITSPYAGRVTPTPMTTPTIVMMAKPRRLEMSIRASGSMAMMTVAAETRMMPSARLRRFRIERGGRDLAFVEDLVRDDDQLVNPSPEHGD